MRSNIKWALAMAVGGVAALAPRALVAGGSIDTSGATLDPGSAPSPGVVTTEESADLGALPADEIGYGALDEPYPNNFDKSLHLGLGGPNFHATTDMTIPPGTYDYGSFTVDKGVTITTNGDTYLRITKDLHLEGRFEATGGNGGGLRIDCAGNVVIVGRDDPVATGFHVLDGGDCYVSAGGDLDVSAETGAKVRFHGYGASMNITCDGEGASVLSDAVFDELDTGNVTVGGDLTATDCEIHTGSGGSLQAPKGSLTVSGGTYRAIYLVAHGDIDAANVTGEGGTRIHDWRSDNGSIHVTGTSSLLADVNINLVAMQDVEIGAGCSLHGTNATAEGGTIWLSGTHGHVTIAAGASLVNDGNGSIEIDGGTDVQLAGSIGGAASWTQLYAVGGDVVLADGSSVDLSSGGLALYAAGAVVALGGSVTVTANEVDIRSHTGDTDLDLSTMRASGGKIVTRSNGVVRLRGSYEAARDIQVFSLLDAIDIHGATLTTDAAGSAPSGFVRAVTYASTATIDAGDATLRTGTSDAQSGDILIQVAASGSPMSEGLMKVARVVARRVPDGVVTHMTGTIAAPKLQQIDLKGSALLTAGQFSRRLFLQGVKGVIRGTNQTVTIRLSRAGRNKSHFVLEIHEDAAVAGTQATVRFARAGLHAEGKFRRPKAK